MARSKSRKYSKLSNHYKSLLGMTMDFSTNLNPVRNSWARLFRAIQRISPWVKINNVDDRLTDKVNQLREVGLDNFINQYEMELKIKRR